MAGGTQEKAAEQKLRRPEKIPHATLSSEILYPPLDPHKIRCHHGSPGASFMGGGLIAHRGFRHSFIFLTHREYPVLPSSTESLSLSFCEVDVSDEAKSMPSLSEIASSRVADVLSRRTQSRALRAAALEQHAKPLKMNLQLTLQAQTVGSASTETAGYLVAAGDSWFDYPFPFDDDILVQLHDRHGYNVESSAHHGDRIESMPFSGGQLDKFRRCVDKLHDQGITPTAVLLSGGGNDFAGDEFGMLLNTAASPIKGWNQQILDGLINVRLRNSYQVFILAINELCSKILGKTLPILVHGYDYPIPDGRGFLGGGLFPGPWLRPGFNEKLFDDLKDNTDSMKVVLNQFNTMLSDLSHDASLGAIHYIDLRGTLSSVLADDAYQEDWNNELHPTEKGFIAVAEKFANVLATL